MLEAVGLLGSLGSSSSCSLCLSSWTHRGILEQVLSQIILILVMRLWVQPVFLHFFYSSLCSVVKNELEGVCVCVCVNFCNFFSFIPHYLSNLRAKVCYITGGLSFYCRRQKILPPSSNSCRKRSLTWLLFSPRKMLFLSHKVLLSWTVISPTKVAEDLFHLPRRVRGAACPAQAVQEWGK